ncbi:SMP-30/gluconolactonase/LRE family protein [Aquimarina sp. Aq78]|uniref:SMP-30/gluconolactonase/LRE family protein n=1 Tax=Aquimarina sp. Aq78 TaxID=1191889 RepID=UPI00131DCDC4|nr:SMP-30/gluconolactonase/LRE family protein [Aquimarina sp. Aq78]
MLNTKSIFMCLVLLGLISCISKKSELIELNFEKDLMPEGIAVDGSTKKLYLNSLKNNKIVSSSLDGSNPTIFLKTNKHNYLAGFGMTIKGDTLYALGNSLTGDKNKSILLLLQLSSGDLIDSYSINDSNFHYLNDLAISSNNEIFITDSESNKIYKIQRPNKTIEIYLDSEEVSNSNGITISDNDEYLYLASNNGICIIETISKKIINEPKESYSGIDGIKYHKNNLYGIVNGWSDKSQNGLFKFELNKIGTEILESKKIVEFTESFKIPTTFDIFDGNIYFVINTQIDNFDENTNEILDLKKLESYTMMKTKAE